MTTKRACGRKPSIREVLLHLDQSHDGWEFLNAGRDNPWLAHEAMHNEENSTKREIVRADKTPNSRYHNMRGFVVGEPMIGVNTTHSYVQVVWIDPSPHGDWRQVMDREHLTTIGYDNPDHLASDIIAEEP